VKNADHMLEDYQCSIPHLILDYALIEYTFDLILSSNLRKARTNEEAMEIETGCRDFLKSEYPDPINDRIKAMGLIEEDDSVIWGEHKYWHDSIQFLRVPKKDINTLFMGMDRAVEFIVNPSPYFNNMVKEIAGRLKQLDQDKENILKDLKRSLYCQCFSGDCIYLGSGPN